MPTREEIDLELLRFLRDMKAREGREDNGTQLAIRDLTAQVQLLGQKLDANSAITNERIAGLAARVADLEKDADDTGVTNVQELRERAKFWPQLLGKIAVGVIVAALAASTTFFITRSGVASGEAAQHAH